MGLECIFCEVGEDLSTPVPINRLRPRFRRALGRKSLQEEEGVFVLREAQISYDNISTPNNSILSLKTQDFGRIHYDS